MDLFEAGIVDPTKVMLVALENAVSVASVLLLTEATLTEIPSEKKTAAAPAMEMWRPATRMIHVRITAIPAWPAPGEL